MEATLQAARPIRGPHGGWQKQEIDALQQSVEAAERLTRAGTIPPNVILGLYTERDPAASGGVWDRVRAFQNFEAALSSGDAARVTATLPEAWAKMQNLGWHPLALKNN